MYGERRIVIMALLLLFLSITFVYYVYFNSNENKFSSLKEMFFENKTKDLKNLAIDTGNNKPKKNNEVNNKKVGTSKGTKESVSTGNLMEEEKKFLSGVETIITGSNNADKNIEILSGTDLWTGDIKLLSRINIDSKNILKGKYNSYFVQIDDDFSKIKESVGKIGGNTVEIGTKKNIIKNSLTGKKVMYINLPKYKEKLVNMAIKTEDKKWFIQVDYNDYYKFKDYLRKILNK